MREIPILSEPIKATPIYELNFSYTENKTYIKRDDFVPFSFGGNKARKAWYFYTDILKKQADVIVSYGSSSSNHCRIVANMATAMGIECHIISPKEKYKETANSRLIVAFGAIIETCPVNEVSATIDRRLDSLRREGKTPYFIMGGGHGNFGTASYIDVYNEIMQFENESGVHFDYIFHASGTGTTQAGLVCGQMIASTKGEKFNADRQKIVGISISRTAEKGYEVIKESIEQYLSAYKLPYQGMTEDYLNFIDQYRKGGYGEYDVAIKETIDNVMKYEGIPMDTTYVGKAFCGMNEYLMENHIRNKTVLFIHTGGTPLFFD